jgi:hypothetical protein
MRACKKGKLVMTQRQRYFDRNGRECSPTEATRNGVLRDGFSMRVPTVFRDSRFADARSLWDQGNLRCTDARAIGGVEGCRPGFRVLDNDLGRQAIADARAAYIFDLENAWRTPPRDAAFGAPPYGAYPLSAGAGNPCTIDGAAGILTRQGDVLICKPLASDARTDERDCPDCDGTGEIDGEDCERCDGTGELDDDDNGDKRSSATSDRRTVDQIAADHAVAMERVYAARNREISEAWREGKATNG